MPQLPAQRLQKALAHLGLGSRREVEAWIRAGRLTVNGATAELGTRVRESDRIRLDGRLVRQRPAPSHQVFVCHRSPGERLDRGERLEPSDRGERLEPSDRGERDEQLDRGEPTAPTAQSEGPVRQALLDRLPRAGGRRFITISPMPQPDGGLELVTSDGEIAERLQRAVRGLTAEFSVRLRGELAEPQLASVRAGTLDGGRHVEVLDCAPGGGEGANHWYTLTARGASGRDVRQLFERCGAILSRVLRTRLGTVALDRTLSRGRFRRLSAPELHALLGSPEADRRKVPQEHRRPGPTARRSSRR